MQQESCFYDSKGDDMKKVLAFIALAAVVCATPAFAADPIVGTWKLNVAKSKFAAGSELTAASRTYSESNGTYTLKQSVTTADGKTNSTTAQYREGVELKQPAGAVADSVTAKKMDANTWDFDLKKDGKAVGHVHRTVSADGKTLTVQQSGARLGGGSGEETLVFDKQ
jgi:hypothetical protein